MEIHNENSKSALLNNSDLQPACMHTYTHKMMGQKGFSSKHIIPIKFSVDDDRFFACHQLENLNAKGSLSLCVCVLMLVNCQCSFSLFIKIRCKYYIHAHHINERMNERTHARTHLTICNATQCVYKKLNSIQAISRMTRYNVYTHSQHTYNFIWHACLFHSSSSVTFILLSCARALSLFLFLIHSHSFCVCVCIYV